METKSLTRYLAEFILIFLAVTLGFFAENLREEYVERQEAKEFALSLYNDLKVDTAVISRNLKEKEWINQKFDTLIGLLDSGDIQANTPFIYYMVRYLTARDVFTAQDVTYSQMRNSAHFKYFRESGLQNAIARYYNLYSLYQSIDGKLSDEERNRNLIPVLARLFYPPHLDRIYNRNGQDFYSLALRPDFMPAPLMEDEDALRKFLLMVSHQKTQNLDASTFLKWLQFNANDLLTRLKKEFPVEQ